MKRSPSNTPLIPVVVDNDNAMQAQVVEALDRSQAMIHFTPDGYITDANPNFLRATGYSLDEVKGKHHSMFMEREAANSPEYLQFWEDLRRGEFQCAVYKRVGKGGREVWIQATYNPVLDKDGRVTRVVKMATDVTLQTVKSKEAVDKTQACITFNLDGTIAEANQNFLDTMGYTMDEIKGKHHSMFVEPEFANSIDYRNFWQALNRGEFQAGEFKRLGRGGKPVHLQASYNPVYDKNGRPVKVTKYAMDITAKSRALAMQTSEVADGVAHATQELKTSIGDIASSMSGTRDSVMQASDKVEMVKNSMQRLVDNALHMSEIVGLIEKISEKINLLALNATIEAARAGDAGRGFSVVADEVKKLAGQTEDSTGKIAEEIKGIQQLSNSVMRSMDEIGDLMDVITQGSNSIAAATEEQSAVTAQIFNNVLAITDIINANK